jgi:putative NIF3 family GTP cyclohydrolase 1 type 2
MMRILLTLLILLAIHRAQTLRAGEAISLIQHRYAATSPPNTVDTLKAGDPNTLVTGIATTFLDTMEVLREAVRRGDNLIIPHEPTFYNHLDDTKFFTDDPVLQREVGVH